MPTFTAEQILNGVNGTLKIAHQPDQGDDVSEYHLVGNVTDVSARVTIDRRPVKVAGTWGTSFKRMGWMGEGTLVVWRANSMFYTAMYKGANRNEGMPNFVLNINISDPDLSMSPAAPDQLKRNGFKEETMQLTGVKLWTFDWGFNVEDLLNQSIEFTFEGVELTETLGINNIPDNNDYYQVPGNNTGIQEPV